MAHPFITTFKKAAQSYGNKPAIRVPTIKVGRVIEGWRDVTYAQFYDQLDIVAKYWSNTLKLPCGSIVALWYGLTFIFRTSILTLIQSGCLACLTLISCIYTAL